MPGKGGEVVTRQPYRKVWLDHLLSKEHSHIRETVYASYGCVKTALPSLLFSIQRKCIQDRLSLLNFLKSVSVDL